MADCAELRSFLTDHVNRAAAAYGYSRPFVEKMVQAKARDTAAYFNASPPLSGAVDALSADPNKSIIQKLDTMTTDELLEAGLARYYDANPVSPDAIVDPVRAREFGAIKKKLGPVGKSLIRPPLGKNDTAADPYEVNNLEKAAPLLLDMVGAVSDFQNFLEMQTPFYGIMKDMVADKSEFMLNLMLNLSRLRGQLRLDKDGKRLDYPHPRARMVDQLLGEVVKRLPSRSELVKTSRTLIKNDPYHIADFMDNIDKSGNVMEVLKSFHHLRAMSQIYEDYGKKYGDMVPALRKAAEDTEALRKRGAKLFYNKYYSDREFDKFLSNTQKAGIAFAKHGIYTPKWYFHRSIDPLSAASGDYAQQWIESLTSQVEKIFPAAKIIWTDKIVEEHDFMHPHSAVPDSPDAQQAGEFWKFANEDKSLGAFIVPRRSVDYAVIPMIPHLGKAKTAEYVFHEMMHVMIGNGYFTSDELQTMLAYVGPDTEIFGERGLAGRYQSDEFVEESLTFYLGQELSRTFNVEKFHSVQKRTEYLNEDYWTQQITNQHIETGFSAGDWRINVSKEWDVARIVDDIYSGKIAARGPRSGYSRPPEFTVAFKGEMDMALAAYNRDKAGKPNVSVSPEASQLAQVAMHGMDEAAEAEIEWISDPDAPALDIDMGGDINPMDTQLEAEVWEDMVRPDIVEHLGKTRAVHPNLNQPTVVTVHDGGNAPISKFGKSLSNYTGPVVLSNAKPVINPEGAKKVAAGKKSEAPIAAIVGLVQNRIPAGYKKGPEIKFNPKRETGTMKADGKPVKEADYVIQEGNKTYLCVKDPDNPRCF